MRRQLPRATADNKTDTQDAARESVSNKSVRTTATSELASTVDGAATLTPPSRTIANDLVESTVTTVQQFIEATLAISPSAGVLWYRGHSKESHRLVPSLYRNVGGKPADELRRLETQLNRRFRDRSMPYSFQGRDESSDASDLQSWWRLFTMQHYGTPTRLLDWSENALLALCFAVLGTTKNPSEHAVVWVLDPCRWNNIGNQNHTHPVSVDEHGVEPYAPLPSLRQHVVATWPLAVFGMHNSPRIVTQQGTFVVFPPGNAMMMEDHALNSAAGSGKNALRAIRLHKDHIEAIAKDLRRLGFAHSSLYPDLHGLSTDLKKEFGY